MPKTWGRGDAKRFARQLELGRTYWIVMNVARNIAPYEDAQLCSAYVFTKRLPFTGTPCTDGDYSAETLCQNFGPVYDEKPRGIRDIADAAPQVAGPLPAGYEAILDHAEIRGMEKLASDGSNPRKRRLIGTWRV
ncbi:hypothetical protein ABZ725_14350 [Streptomyces sp. NPDC006872]|uniref:hypothetical protein n=1 Tax=Streptomyces sp. NPDC006872 TaxID=3155720 RepID=UPI0033D12B7A